MDQGKGNERCGGGSRLIAPVLTGIIGFAAGYLFSDLWKVATPPKLTGKSGASVGEVRSGPASEQELADSRPEQPASPASAAPPVDAPASAPAEPTKPVE